MKVYAYQKWHDYSGVILIDNLGLSDEQISQLLDLGYTAQVTVVSQESLVEELVFQVYEQGLFSEPGMVVLPGKGALRAWTDFETSASALELNPDWITVRIEARRVILGREPVVELNSQEESIASAGQQWIAVLDDVVSTGATVQAVRQAVQPSSLSWKVMTAVINLGRRKPTAVGFDEVYAGLAVRGCKGRNRIPIASFQGFLEREGWAQRFGEKYARRVSDFVAFWEEIGDNMARVS